MGAWLALPVALERVVVWRAGAFGLDVAEVDVRRVGWGRIEVADFDSSGGALGSSRVQIASAVVDYGLGSWGTGPWSFGPWSVRRIALAGVRVHARWDAGRSGLPLGSAVPGAGGRGLEGLPPIFLRSGSIGVETVAGVVRAGMRGETHAPSGSFRLWLRDLSLASASSGDAAFTIAEAARVDFRDGAARLFLAPDLRIEGPGLARLERILRGEPETGGAGPLLRSIRIAPGDPARPVASLGADGVEIDALARGVLASAPEAGLVSLQAAGRLRADEGALRFDLRECASLDLARRGPALQGLRSSGPLRLCPDAAGEPALHADGAGGLRGVFDLAPSEFRGDGFSGVSPLVHVAWSLEEDGPRAVLDGSGGAGVLLDEGRGRRLIGLEGIDFRAVVDRGGLRGPAPLSIAVLRDLRGGQAWTPLRFEGEASADGSASRGLAFSIAGNAVPVTGVRDVRARVSGTWRADGEGGTPSALLLVEHEPVRFRPGGLQPDDLFPVLARRLSEVDGAAAGRLRVDWTPGHLRADIDLSLQGVSFEWGSLGFEDAVGAVSIDPLASPPALRSADLALVRADAGLAVEDVVLSFTQSADGVVVVRDTSFSVLGGRVRAAGRLDTEGEHALVLDVAGVDFGVLLERIGVPGLSGRGTIDGRLPLHRHRGRLEIREGHLEARLPGGWLRYRPDAGADALPPAVKGSALVASVLENLHFQRLEADLEGEAMGEIDLRLHLLGHSPDVYGGVPVELIIEDRKLPLAATLRVANASERLLRALDRRLERFDLSVVSE